MDNIFFYGACELLDAADRLKKIAPYREYEFTQGTQSSSIFSKEGRIRDTVRKWWYKHVGDNNRVYKSFYKPIYEEFVKNTALLDINSEDNDWLIINFSLELSPTFSKDKEYLYISNECKKAMQHAIKNKKFPQHIYDLLTDKQYYVSFNDEWRLHILKNEWREKYIEAVEPKFKNRIMVFSSEPVTRYRNNKIGVYQELPELKKSVAVYQDSKQSKQFSGAESRYGTSKVLRYICTGFRLSYPYRIKHLHIKSSNLIGDDHHNRGKHPHHYDNQSITHIAKQIDFTLIESSKEEVQKRISIKERVGVQSI